MNNSLSLAVQGRVQMGIVLNPSNGIKEEDTSFYITEEDSNKILTSED
jgi:hypothetical protein